MTVQIRPRDNPSGLAYSPMRDIAHLFPKIVHAAAMTLTEDAVASGDWPWRCLGPVDPEALDAAATVYFEKIRLTYLDPGSPPSEILAGLSDVDERAMTILLTAVGLASTVAYIKGAREAHTSVNDAALGARDLVDATHDLQWFASRGWLSRAFARVRRLWPFRFSAGKTLFGGG